MSKGLEGKTIALAASRNTDEMKTLVEKQGGTAIVRSLQGTTFLAEQEIEADLKKLVDEGADWFVFTTGIGTNALVEAAKKLRLEDKFLSMLRQGRVAARGYKTIAVLKKLGMELDATDEDGTIEGLIRAIEPIDFSKQKVVIQLHGEASPKLTAFLENKGATVEHLLPYRNVAPAEETVETLVNEMFTKKVDAICFTTMIQVRALFTYAKQKGIKDKLIESFQNDVLAVAVGKVTAETLREENIERYIAPTHERMGAMIIELSKYYQQQNSLNT